MTKTNYAVIEIFAGAGGLGTGLEMAGLPVEVAIEIDPIACETYQQNHPETKVWCRDIKEVTGEEIRQVVGSRPIILAGGPPCQSWSEMQVDIEGSKKGLEDDRGQMIYQYLRICQELQPELILFENVSHLVSEQHLPAFSEFKAKLQSRTGLDLSFKVLNAIDFGVAQLRERVIMMGVKPGMVLPFERLKPIEGPATLREQLEDCPESEAATFTPYEASIMAKIPAGKCWNVLPPLEAQQALGKDYKGICNHCRKSFVGRRTACPACGSTDFRNGFGFTSYWRRLSWEKPSFTVCTVSPTKAHGTLAHPEANRGLSYRECARLQGFPDDYVFAGSLKDKYRQIGNAVPVTLGMALGRAILDVLADREPAQEDLIYWMELMVQFPDKGALTSLERDFLSTVFRKMQSGKPVPERYAIYVKETYLRATSSSPIDTALAG